MSVDFDKGPQYDAVVEALLEKTREGKLTWQETADPDTFLAAVKGKQTFEIRQDSEEPVLIDLVVRDGGGNVSFNVSFDTRHSLDSPAEDLFALAKRLATRVDEKIDATRRLLSDL